MKKFFIFALLCGFVGMPALAKVPTFDQDDVFVLDSSKSYGCDLTNSLFGGQAAYVDFNVTGGYLQSFGDAVLDGRQVGTHVRFLCDAGNDEWDIVETNWCSGTEINKTGVAFAVYEMRAGGSVYKTAAAHKDGCIFAQCEKGRAYFSGQCLSQEEINQRKEMCDGKPQGTVENVTVEECKKVWANKDGVNAIMACTRKCGKNANGAGVWKVSVTQCIEPYRVVNAGGVACKLDNNGGNGGGNGGGNDGKVKCDGKQLGTEENADLATCKERFKKAKADGHDAITSCTRICLQNNRDNSGFWSYQVRACATGYRVENSSEIACVKENGNGNGGGNGGNRTSSLERCLKGRTSAEGQACCYLPASVAKWENNKCVCQTPNMEFKIGPNGRGQCNAKPVAPGATFNCEPAVMGVLETWLVQCATKADIVSMITQIKTLCTSPSRTADKFNTLYSTLLALNPGDCATVVQPEQPVVPIVPIDDTAEKLRKSRRNISDAHGILVGMRETFKASVWKDEEGKFNTSRLVSDSIAGVVLGTVGGVVTSNVVKKNQVENGFEDIKCTVGGQTVADWGDEFRVGIQ